jgi:hypothetical protein
MKGYPAELAAFSATFDDPDIAISAFVAGPAAHVELVNLEQRLPQLFAQIRTTDPADASDE